MIDGQSTFETVAFLIGGTCCLVGSLLALHWQNYRTALLSLVLAALLLNIPILTTPIQSHVIKIDLPINDKR